nr:alpha/beta hydrolase [Sphingomonas sp. H160509]
MVAPSRPNGAAVLVAAGGGYKRIEMASEARPAAGWLAAHGITAFILRYRLPGEGWNAGPLAPLQDAQRALRMIQANADTWRIDPSRLGVLGFSSGGHLMGLAATRSGFASYPPADAIDAFSGRPQDAALIYPIITLQPPYDHTSLRRVLIGSRPSAAESAEWSVETHVRAKCPPIFLVQAVDDPISNPQNTIIMADACRAANIPVELHRLASGGHGFGMGSPNTPTGGVAFLVFRVAPHARNARLGTYSIVSVVLVALNAAVIVASSSSGSTGFVRNAPMPSLCARSRKAGGRESGHDDRRRRRSASHQFFPQVQPGYAGHVHIGYQAIEMAMSRRFEKGFGAIEHRAGHTRGPDQTVDTA